MHAAGFPRLRLDNGGRDAAASLGSQSPELRAFLESAPDQIVPLGRPNPWRYDVWVTRFRTISDAKAEQNRPKAAQDSVAYTRVCNADGHAFHVGRKDVRRKAARIARELRKLCP